ncbi:hypothetical protein [Reichenbachiella ulvae]|uniref:DUF4468 domain-containing protein n=1 Tax=Reichenbachiella ulvae TaxID=2980104 RepID=A0ABT3CSK4_9BACT|nr:hypothetical protein [Reichenbachiella ulvae]MCV9386233.1 hypothetical protein [Reichenbachiella ulvae]
MRLILASILYLAFLSPLVAQDFSTRLWHKGWAVTMDGDTLRGDIKYDMEVNTIQILSDDKVYTYNSKKVMYVEFFDSLLKSYRQFYSIPYNVTGDFRAPILFEVLYEGPTTLLAREKIVLETDPYSQSYYYTGPGTTRERLSLTFFFAFKDGSIERYSGKKGELYAILDDHPGQLKDYIKKNKLDVNEVRDLVRIMAFYNSI